MLIFHDKRLVLITPPKCASTTLHKWFCSRGAWLCIGPQGVGEIDKHTTHVPFDCRSPDRYHVAVVVRDPVARYHSLWRMFCRFHHSISAERFAASLESRGWFFSWTISHLLYDRPVDSYWQCEHLDAACRDAGLEPPTIHANAYPTDHQPSPTFVSIIERHAAEDYDRFGYSRKERTHVAN